MKLPNGAQMHELNKFIGTATTAIVVGVVVYSELSDRRDARRRRAVKSKMYLIDSALDRKDRDLFNKIVKDF